jgi:hypothetical protein
MNGITDAKDPYPKGSAVKLKVRREDSPGKLKTDCSQ